MGGGAKIFKIFYFFCSKPEIRRIMKGKEMHRKKIFFAILRKNREDFMIFHSKLRFS